MPRKRKFQGFDFTEVIEHFRKKGWYEPLILPEDAHSDPFKNEHLTNKHFTDWLWTEYHNNWNNKRRQSALVKPCKEYLNAAIGCCHFYTKPLWQGLADVQHDETFLKYFTHLFESIWT